MIELLIINFVGIFIFPLFLVFKIWKTGEEHYQFRSFHIIFHFFEFSILIYFFGIHPLFLIYFLVFAVYFSNIEIPFTNIALRILTKLKKIPGFFSLGFQLITSVPLCMWRFQNDFKQEFKLIKDILFNVKRESDVNPFYLIDLKNKNSVDLLLIFTNFLNEYFPRILTDLIAIIIILKYGGIL